MNLFSKSFAAILLSAGCSMVGAHDFTATVNGQKIYFNIMSKTNKTVEITYNGGVSEKKTSEIQGDIEIPSKVKHNDIVYSVVAIGAKSFSGANKLKGITIPSTVKSIGDFAFEGCSSLSKIIFPGGNVEFGEGVFFKCTSVRDITLGSDWKHVNLSRFKWSDSLKVIMLPAKIERIQGLKSLKKLENVSVDVNNGKFSSCDGVLYSKDGKTLYGCPRSYSGELKIKDGTEVINSGAFIDCPYITLIDIPATIQSFSFREPSRMKLLETIVFRGDSPVNTAYVGKDGRFVLQVANVGVRIVVPNRSKKKFKSSLIKEGGEFAETKDENSTPYMVRADEMPKESNFIGVKNFSKYN